MLNRVLLGAVVAATAVAAPALAWAEPAPPGPPAPPNVLALTPASPVDFAVTDGLYAFTAPGGVTCVLARSTRSYGCSGNLPGAPNGANVVTAGAGGEPGFSQTDRPLYHFEAPPKALAEGTRLGMATVNCGVIGGGVVCTNTFDQTGFVISPAVTYSFGGINPLLDRPEGTNPYIN